MPLPVLAGAALVVLASVALVLGTRDILASRADERAAREIDALLGDLPHDNRPLRDRLSFPADAGQVAVYPARTAGRLTGAVVRVSAPDGYGGPVELVVAFDAAGTIRAIRIESHRETPGIGAQVADPDSRWLGGFLGHTPALDTPGAWALRRDGGQFDQLTGATVTSRAVTAALLEAARVFEAHRAEIEAGR